VWILLLVARRGDADTGVISGTPTTTGQTTVTVTVADPTGLTGTSIFTWTVTEPLTLTNPGAQGSAYNAPANLQMQANGGLTPYTWAATGLPLGVGIDPDTGEIRGTAFDTGTHTVSVTVTDPWNAQHWCHPDQRLLGVGKGRTVLLSVPQSPTAVRAPPAFIWSGLPGGNSTWRSTPW
jgi:hypothetical protein